MVGLAKWSEREEVEVLVDSSGDYRMGWRMDAGLGYEVFILELRDPPDPTIFRLVFHPTEAFAIGTMMVMSAAADPSLYEMMNAERAKRGEPPLWDDGAQT